MFTSLGGRCLHSWVPHKAPFELLPVVNQHNQKHKEHPKKKNPDIPGGYLHKLGVDWLNSNIFPKFDKFNRRKTIMAVILVRKMGTKHRIGWGYLTILWVDEMSAVYLVTAFQKTSPKKG